MSVAYTSLKCFDNSCATCPLPVAQSHAVSLFQEAAIKIDKVYQDMLA